ncbi:MAG TPA: hypothetical protein VN281_07770 [Verrucomicrobiae bacterium]|nr:hypothetical protein [Verrucomicrobiae bacterium]
MKTITFVSVASLLVVSATMSVLQSPEKIPQAVWREVPTIPGIGPSDAEWQQISRTYGSLTEAEKAANARRLAVQHAMQAAEQQRTRTP